MESDATVWADGGYTPDDCLRVALDAERCKAYGARERWLERAVIIEEIRREQAEKAAWLRRCNFGGW